MKEKFLALVEEVKTTGIATALRATTNASEFEAVGQKFFEDYKELFEKIAAWAEEFRNSECGVIFNKGETIEAPMEIAIILHIINDVECVSEDEIFETYQMLIDAIRDIGDDFSTAVADFAENDYYCNIKAEDIFGADEDGEEESEEGQEDADCGDADEADSNEAEFDATEADDEETE